MAQLLLISTVHTVHLHRIRFSSTQSHTCMKKNINEQTLVRMNEAHCLQKNDCHCQQRWPSTLFRLWTWQELLRMDGPNLWVKNLIYFLTGPSAEALGLNVFLWAEWDLATSEIILNPPRLQSRMYVNHLQIHLHKNMIWAKNISACRRHLKTTTIVLSV